MSLRGTHDPTVRCQNANGLIDSLMLNCLFELISTLRPLYMEECQSLCTNVTWILSICHSISLWEFENEMVTHFLKGCCPLIHLGQTFMNKTNFNLHHYHTDYLDCNRLQFAIVLITHRLMSRQTCTNMHIDIQSKVSEGYFFTAAVIPVSIIAECWELNISQVHPLPFSHLSHQTIMLNFRVKAKKNFQALPLKRDMEQGHINMCLCIWSQKVSSETDVQKYTHTSSVCCVGANTSIQHRLQKWFAFKRWVFAFSFLSWNCHPNASFIKVIDVWCYHLQWHSKEG